jgi:hypothetical protein
MGTDIDGWIECRTLVVDNETWDAVMDFRFIYRGRDYDSFGCLFGVRNTANFRPIAPDRGLPHDVSEQVKKEATFAGLYAHTWITWSEIRNIDWEEYPEPVVHRILVYKRTESGELVYIGINEYSPSFEKYVGYSRGNWQEGEEWEFDDTVFRVERLKRKAIRIGWEATFKVLEVLANLYGDDNVRLVVWFED